MYLMVFFKIVDCVHMDCHWGGSARERALRHCRAARTSVANSFCKWYFAVGGCMASCRVYKIAVKPIRMGSLFY